MEQIRLTETFCGIDIFTWESWDTMEEMDMLYFYNVEFLMDSMKQYNGCDVMRRFDGSMEIYSKDKSVVWKGIVPDIPEVTNGLLKQKKDNKSSGFVGSLKEKLNHEHDF